MGNLKNRVYKVLNGNQWYMGVSIFVICASLVPLMFAFECEIFCIIEYTTTGIFILDYLARWFTCEIALKRGKLSYLIYPFTFMAIIDLLSILPTFTIVNQGFKALRVLRLIRLARLFRFVRESKSFQVIAAVLKKERSSLGAVCVIALAYVFVTALITFNVEPETFSSFFDAVYWSCISLTTVGYGDIYPVTVFGRVIAMISSLVGIAVVALPAGIITGGYMDIMRNGFSQDDEVS